MRHLIHVWWRQWKAHVQYLSQFGILAGSRTLETCFWSDRLTNHLSIAHAILTEAWSHRRKLGRCKERERERVDSLLKHEKIPMTLLKLSNRRGANCKGIKRRPQRIFHSLTPTPGIKRSRVSAKSTTKATHAANNSNVNRTLVAIRAFCP